MADGVQVDAREVLAALRDAQAAAGLESSRSAVEGVLTRALSAASPRRTGFLARSARPIRAQGAVAGARSTARYAGPVNSGVPSRGIRATLYTERAADAAERQVSVITERRLAQDIRG